MDEIQTNRFPSKAFFARVFREKIFLAVFRADHVSFSLRKNWSVFVRHSSFPCQVLSHACLLNCTVLPVRTGLTGSVRRLKFHFKKVRVLLVPETSHRVVKRLNNQMRPSLVFLKSANSRPSSVLSTPRYEY